jgi:hypothetical protein
VDVAGEFVVSDLPVGRYALLFRYREYSFGIPRTIYVTALSTLAPVDIYLRIPGEISGLVLDSGGAPIPGSRVLLVTSEYHAGQLVYTTFSERSTDDRGYYSFSNRTEAGRPYFVLALPPEVDGPTSSGLEATWYPSRPGMSPPFALRSGE